MSHRAARTGVLVALVIAATAGLSGCTPPHYTLTAEETDLPPCPVGPPVDVESLDDTDRAECDLQGSQVIFPDGTLADVTESIAHQNTFSAAEPRSITYSTFNVGIYGIVAATTNPDHTESQWWGRPDALKIVQDAFGLIADRSPPVSVEG